MKMPGPPKTPTPILKLRGSWRANTRPNEPQPPRKRPSKPGRLPADAAKLWDEICDQLAEMGVLAPVDGHALERYCRMLAQWWRLYKVIEEEGDTYEVKGRDGQVRHRLRPEARTVMSLHDSLLKIERQFGMTPAARAGLSIPPGTSGGTDDDHDDFQLRR